MAHLREIDEKIGLIIEKLLANQDLCKYLTYFDSDPLSHEDVENTFGLLNTRILTTPFFPLVEGYQGCSINVFSGTIREEGVNYKNAEIKFLISCHYDAWNILDGLRPNKIASLIEDMVNFKEGFGVGRMLFAYKRNLQVADKVFAYELCYVTSDFGRDFRNNK